MQQIILKLQLQAALSSTSASPAHPEPEWPFGAAASAERAPWCRRTEAGQAEHPGPAGSSVPGLGPLWTV